MPANDDRPTNRLAKLLRDARPAPPSDDDEAAILSRLYKTLDELGGGAPGDGDAPLAAGDDKCSRVA